MKKFWNKIKFAVNNWFNRKADLRSCIVFHDNQRKVYDKNGVLRVRMGVW